jgi:hypothetical protein
MEDDHLVPTKSWEMEEGHNAVPNLRVSTSSTTTPNAIIDRRPKPSTVVSPDIARVTTDLYRQKFCGAGHDLIMMPDTGKAPGTDQIG